MPSYTVDVDLSDFDTDELREELQSRGYNVFYDIDSAIDEVETHGYKVIGNEEKDDHEKLVDELHDLYYSYVGDKVEVFEREFKKLVSKTLDKNVIDLRLL